MYSYQEINYNNSVSIIAPLGVGPHGYLIRAFIRSLEAYSNKIMVSPFYTRGLNTMNITRTLEDVFGESSDLIVTIGTKCAVTTVQYMKKHDIDSPVLITGLTPSGFKNFLEAEIRGLSNVYAVLYPDFDTQESIEFLYEAKPLIKSSLILYNVYSSSNENVAFTLSWLGKEINIVKEFFSKHGVVVEDQYLKNSYNFLTKNIKQYDCIILLDGTVSLDLHDAVGRLCSHHGVTLFTGMRTAVQSSSALGYGAEFTPLGEAAADYARRILFEKLSPRDLPVTTINNIRTAAVNTALAERQGLDSDHIVQVCKSWNGVVFDSVIEDSY